MSRLRITFASMIIMSLAALAAACGSDPTPAATAPAATATPVPTATPEAMMMIAPADVFVVPLNEVSGSGQSGYAKLVANGDQIDVSLSLGVGSMRSEKAHIHAGSCADLGGVEHPLADFAGGSGSSETTVATSLSSLGSGDFAINAHEAGNPGNYTACGDLPAATAATTIALNAIAGSGQDGFATLVSVGGTTVVAAELPQGSLASEKVHIHAGRCGDGLGGVDYPLTDFAGGSGGSVTIVEASLASLLGTPHAINVHEAGNPGNYTSCGELPSGVMTP